MAPPRPALSGPEESFTHSKDQLAQKTFADSRASFLFFRRIQRLTTALAGPLLLRTAGIRQHSFLSLYPFDFPEEWRAFLLQPRMVEFAPSQKHCPPAGAGSALSEARRRFGSGRMPSGHNRKLLGLL